MGATVTVPVVYAAKHEEEGGLRLRRRRRCAQGTSFSVDVLYDASGLVSQLIFLSENAET